MSNTPRKITRAQLAEFLPDARAIRAFEQVLKQMAELYPEQLATILADIESNSIDSGNANAKADSALYLLDKIADALNMITLAPIQLQPNLLECDSLLFNKNAPTGRALRVAESQWNPTVGTIETQITADITLQHGQETHRRFVNSTGTTINAGEVLAYLSVSGDSEAPNCQRYIADGSMSPFLVAGVATNTAANGEIVYATAFGLVHNLDTSSYSGNVLYASESVAGALTDVKPSAPNVVTPVALLVNVSATVGHIFVAPHPAPRLYYGTFSDTTSQALTSANTIYPITFNTTDAASGFSRGVTTSQIIAANSGLYTFNFSLQVTSSNASSITVYIWCRKNGSDVANSCRKITIKSNSDIIVPAWSYSMAMAASDYFELVAVADSTGITIAAVASSAAPFVRPAVPSALLSVYQVNL